MYCKIHPRKPNRNIKYITVSKDDIEKYFNISLGKAAKKIGVSVTTLKKTCRFFDINKWPYTRKKINKKYQNNISNNEYNISNNEDNISNNEDNLDNEDNISNNENNISNNEDNLDN